MESYWIISKVRKIDESMPLIFKNEVANLFTSNIEIKKYRLNGQEVYILVDGYVIPRMEYFESYKSYQNEELIARLFEKKQFRFIDYIKGLFVLIMVVDGVWHFYSDHLGIKKFFYSIRDKNDFIISSNLKYITDRLHVEVEPENLLINILLNHYIDGKTLFKNIFYSKPATKMILSRENIVSDSHWSIDELLKNRKNSHNIDYIPEFFRSLVKSYVEYFRPEQISVSITGGLDCRQILAALLANNIITNTYTYGHPHSIDVHFGKMVAEEMRLEHSHYYPEEVSKNWFERLANEIVERGNSITSIHRAHRLHAIKKEALKCDLMFLGYMGGEVVRGNWPDDLIISAFMRQYWQGKKSLIDLAMYYANQNFFKIETIDLVKLESYFKSVPFVGKTNTINNFYFLFLVQTFVHYAQDINLFSSYIKNVVPIFIDIDYLKIIFDSKYSMLFRSNMTKNKIRRFRSTYFSCYMIDKIWPPLSTIVLSKGYSPRELLSSKVVMLIKRQYRVKRQKHFAPSFKYEKWYYDFFMENLQKDSQVRRYFDVDRAIDVINNYRYMISDERSCLPFTRMIELQKMTKQYRVSI